MLVWSIFPVVLFLFFFFAPAIFVPVYGNVLEWDCLLLGQTSSTDLQVKKVYVNYVCFSCRAVFGSQKLFWFFLCTAYSHVFSFYSCGLMVVYLYLSSLGHHCRFPVQFADRSGLQSCSGNHWHIQLHPSLRPTDDHLASRGSGPLLLHLGHLEHITRWHRPNTWLWGGYCLGIPRQLPSGPIARPTCIDVASAAPIFHPRPDRTLSTPLPPGCPHSPGYQSHNEGSHHPARLLALWDSKRWCSEGQAAHGGGIAISLYRLRNRRVKCAFPCAFPVRTSGSVVIGWKNHPSFWPIRAQLDCRGPSLHINVWMELKPVM